MGAEGPERLAEVVRAKGIRDERLLRAIALLPRADFVPRDRIHRAYSDEPIPIGHEQVTTQPSLVASMLEALGLEEDERVLEIGTGSGYSACVLSRLAREVVTIERIPELSAEAREVLAELGVTNVEVVVGDGSAGLPERAPFEGIAVHATAPDAPASLLEQLSVGGRLVVPIASDGADILTVYSRTSEEVDPRTGTGLERRNLGPVRFVPLIGREGFGEGRDGGWLL